MRGNVPWIRDLPVADGMSYIYANHFMTPTQQGYSESRTFNVKVFDGEFSALTVCEEQRDILLLANWGKSKNKKRK